MRQVGFQQCSRNEDLLEFGKYTAQKYSETVVASCGSLGINSKEQYLKLIQAMPGVDLEEMVTDFRNNKRRRRKVLGGTGARFPGNSFFFRVIHKNLTDFPKTVKTGIDPRLDAILGGSLLTPRTSFPTRQSTPNLKLLSLNMKFTNLANLPYSL